LDGQVLEMAAVLANEIMVGFGVAVVLEVYAGTVSSRSISSIFSMVVISE
jgi:putative heme degradation protein